MADIEIVYREPYCDSSWWAEPACFETQCFTGCAGDMGCKWYSDGGRKINEHGRIEIPFGNCIHAKFKYKYKGWNGKKYEIEKVEDPNNPHLDYMEVYLGSERYECVKVILNGKCIYNEYDEEVST